MYQQPRAGGLPGLNQRLTEILLWALVLATCMAKFVPLHPDFPGSGLDPSWRYAMGQAKALGLEFGRDLIFTFGPYASVYTRLYHPATDFLMLTASGYLGLAYWLAAFLAFRLGPRPWILCYIAVLAGALYSPDPLLFSLPLLIGLAVWRGLDPAQGWLLRAPLPALLLLLLLMPLGLLPLVKGSLLALCCGVALLCAALLLSARQRLLGVISLLGPIAALLLFWLLSGQPLAGLPRYLSSMLPIISGYTEAMSFPGSLRVVPPFLLAGAVLLWAGWRRPATTVARKLFLVALYAGYLFLSFKAGFVRQDGHAAIAGSALVLAAIALALLVPGRLAWAGLSLSLLAWASIDYYHMHTSPAGFIHNVAATYRNAWNGARLRLSDPVWPRNDYDAAVQALRSSGGLPQLAGTTDVYSYQQSELIASGNRWSPRPVLQSYSVYTPALAELNRQHLLGATAPDNVIFRVETIDERFPTLDDGPSWPLLLAGYRPVKLLKDAVLLRKDALAQPATSTPVATTAEHQLGATVTLPASAGKTFVKIDIQPSLLGRLAALLFRPDRLQLTVTLDGGAQRTYRLVSDMARAGFLLSPLIEDSSEFLLLYGAPALLDPKRVVSISLGTSSGKGMLWSHSYRLSLTALPAQAALDVTGMLGAARFSNAPAADTGAAVQCEGFIDAINGQPASTPPAVRSFLRVHGWVAMLPAPRHVAQQVYLVLTDDVGRRHYAPAQAMQRPDVAQHFNQPELIGAGYSLYANVLPLHGNYKLGVAVEQQGHLAHCTQFAMPLVVGSAVP